MSQNASGQDDIIDGEAVVISADAASATDTDSAQKSRKSARKFLPYFWVKGFWSIARRRRLMWVAYCAVFAVLGFILVGQVMGLKAERDRFRAEVIEQGVRITSLEAIVANLGRNDAAGWQTAMTARIDAIDQALTELRQSRAESDNNGIDGAVIEALLARLDRLEEGLKLAREPPPAIESATVTESPIESESDFVTGSPLVSESVTGSVPSHGSPSSQEPPPTTGSHGWWSLLNSLITITPINEE